MRGLIAFIFFILLFVGGLLLLLRLTDDVIGVDIFESSGVIQSPPSGEVLISTDGGVIWDSVRTNNSVADFILKDMYPYEENGFLRILALTNKGVYGSRDNGLNWGVAFDGLPQKPVFDLDVDVSAYQASILVASSNASDFGAVFRSQDGGRNFRQVYVTPTQQQQVIGVQFNRQNKDIVYALLSDGSFLVSNDKGSSWGQYNAIPLSKDRADNAFFDISTQRVNSFCNNKKIKYTEA